MKTLESLDSDLRAMDGEGYKKYKALEGEYQAAGYVLSIDHVQGDPYAEPSRVRALIPPEHAELPEWAYRSGTRRRATADFLNRALHRGLEQASRNAGSGKSGLLTILRPSQEVLARASLTVDEHGGVEARFRVGLPARGRRIDGEAAASMLLSSVPDAVTSSLLYESLDEDRLRCHVNTVEDAVELRRQLSEQKLIAFIADGSGLPRRSGVDDRPLEEASTVSFRSPPELRCTLEAPNAGPITGMGIPVGVTLIVGGGYHGKSTLLRAVERGVYDHIPGDGRERVVTESGAIKIRAEDGRRVAGTDISNFIGELPAGDDTRAFESNNASGSTSQSAAITEALEVGSTCLLLDEDTSATNFMIRDGRMQALISDRNEPITPFIDRAAHLAGMGISTVLVVGGSGDYFDVADRVIAMRSYLPEDVTKEARGIASSQPTRRRAEGGEWRELRRRRPVPDSIDPSRGRRSVNIKVVSRDRVLFGTEEVDLSGLEQIVESAQTRAIAQAVAWARGGAIDGEADVREALTAIQEAIARDGLDAIQPWKTGELAEFRIFELAGFLNRLRTFRTR